MPVDPGPAYWTYGFNRQGLRELADRRGRPLDSIWGNRFQRLRPGDFVYVVAVAQGDLLLVCRIEIAAVDLDFGWATAHHSTPIQLENRLPAAAAAQLRFETSQGAAALCTTAAGRLDPQAIRGVRRLTADAARCLDVHLEQGVAPPPAPTAARMRALSVRQPWVELILRGHKTIEVRSMPTHVRDRVFLYASPIRPAEEVERRLAREFELDLEALPRGVLAGTVAIVGCRPLGQGDAAAACLPAAAALTGRFGWELSAPERLPRLRRPLRRPQPVWFYPFA